MEEHGVPLPRHKPGISPIAQARPHPTFLVVHTMPLKQLRPCSTPGCPVLHRNRGRCDVHQEQNERERQAWIDQNRPTAAVRGYDQEWQKMRRMWLVVNPNCIECGAKATDVDHINSLAEYPELKYAPSNLRGLCHPCHSRRTALDQGFAHKPTYSPSPHHFPVQGRKR